MSHSSFELIFLIMRHFSLNLYTRVSASKTEVAQKEHTSMLKTAEICRLRCGNLHKTCSFEASLDPPVMIYVHDCSTHQDVDVELS